jgi:hypothetical protein
MCARRRIRESLLNVSPLGLARVVRAFCIKEKSRRNLECQSAEAILMNWVADSINSL